MKKVEFVRVKSELCGYGFGKGSKYGFDGVEDIIRERILQGWTYCGYVPIETRGTGDIETMSLVFQRDDQPVHSLPYSVEHADTMEKD